MTKAEIKEHNRRTEAKQRAIRELRESVDALEAKDWPDDRFYPLWNRLMNEATTLKYYANLKPTDTLR